MLNLFGKILADPVHSIKMKTKVHQERLILACSEPQTYIQKTVDSVDKPLTCHHIN